MDGIVIRALNASDIDAAVPLLSYLNPSTEPEILRQRLATILADHPHYYLVGAEIDGKLIGLCGAWIATKIWCGRYLELDNLVVHPDHRSAKAGSQLIGRLEALGREKDCELLVLDSYTSNHPSHRLYHRLGFEIWGFHFVKPLKR